MLEREELKRYNRQIILPEIGLTGQEKLKSARVLVIGAGGLGCPVLQYLVAAGTGHIGIVDDDVVDLSNLHRQILYNNNDIGQPKATVAKAKLELLNPYVYITAITERFTAENAKAIIDGYDLVVDGSDNFTTRYVVNDACVVAGKPLVFGSIFKFEGHVSVFNYLDGPDYRDVFPEAPPEGSVPNCDEIGVLGVLPGIVGCYMANEAIKIICGVGETLAGKLMVLDVLNNTHSVFKVAKQKRPAAETKQAAVAPVTVTVADTEIDMDELHHWLEDTPEDIYLIDVRENYEFEDYNIGGTNIPLYELNNSVEALPADKKLVFCCQTGQRSKMAVQLLKRVFKGEMYNLKDGIF